MIIGDKIKKKIILASASPRRKELMELLGLDFEIIASDFDENQLINPIPSEYASGLALSKALAVAKNNGDALVIGADTVVVKDSILGKPENRQDAINMLMKLQGSVHEVITGLALVDLKKDYIKTASESTYVEMIALSQAQIERYVDTGEPMDKAGAYGIQGSAAAFIPRINGCYFNVVGLPVHRLWSMLNEYKAIFEL